MILGNLNTLYILNGYKLKHSIHGSLAKMEYLPFQIISLPEGFWLGQNKRLKMSFGEQEGVER